ncbi:hypothetical protein [Dactylosporangium matsuzakiense]|uniref:Uncharacterized protein n=1 Tax=Dactylosporangium matsuzakiense TaxID=53360 RepID=A0A9W6NPB3_9ACTN|nr:hypothetical protein [Dactylosporangium matsuzakiense]UWZ42621.1 hypothetical protein Dmats_34480 [Dactylosporangium matsuzakiense]GLL03912.1 hypothetical protein GCM10017581_056580 [Dactylosporangium matsuzakiense]
MAAALQADPVRTRITRPGSGSRTAAAVVVALTLAALGAGFGALLGWLGAPDAVARVADGTPPALWGAYLSSGVRLLSTTGIALLAGAVALAASARVGRSVRKRRS